MQDRPLSDDDADRGDHEATDLKFQVHFLSVRRYIHLKIFRPTANGKIEFLHEMSIGTQFGHQPVDIAVTEQYGGVVILGQIIGTQIEFRGMHGPAPWLESPELVL